MRESVRKLKLLLAAGALLGTGLAVPSFASAAPSGPARMAVPDLKIMNYYPARAGWSAMWTDYSHATTVSDFQAIASLGANTVRIIVQPAAMGYPTVNPQRRQELDDAIQVAAAAHLNVQLTLFDLWHNYSDISGSKTWVSSLLADQRDNPTIALVELQNEMPLSSQSVTWAKAMLPYLSTVLPGVPRTLSQPSGSLSRIEDMLKEIPASDLDAVDVHFYGDPSRAASELETVKSLAGKRPVFIGEAGENTGNTTAGEIAQARFYEIMGLTTNALGLPPAAPWMLNDVTLAGGVSLTPATEFYGLRRPNGTWKPAAYVVSSIFHGGIPQNWDGGMELESNDWPGVTLGAWTPFDSIDGAPTVSNTVARTGHQSVCFSHTTGTAVMMPSVEQSFPVLVPGEKFTVSGYVERSNGVGQERIAIAGYDANGHYVGQVQSPAATGSGYWQNLAVSASAPSGSAWVQVHLKAGDETGTACWDDIAVSMAP